MCSQQLTGVACWGDNKYCCIKDEPMYASTTVERFANEQGEVPRFDRTSDI